MCAGAYYIAVIYAFFSNAASAHAWERFSAPVEVCFMNRRKREYMHREEVEVYGNHIRGGARARESLLRI